MRRTMVLFLVGFMAFLLIPAAFAQEKVKKEAKHQVITRTIDIPGGKAVVKIEIVREGKSAGPRDVDVEVLCPQCRGKGMEKASPPSRAAGKHPLPKGHDQSQIQARSFAVAGGDGQIMVLEAVPEGHEACGSEAGKACEVEVEVLGEGKGCCDRCIEGQGPKDRPRKVVKDVEEEAIVHRGCDGSCTADEAGPCREMKGRKARARRGMRCCDCTVHARMQRGMGRGGHGCRAMGEARKGRGSHGRCCSCRSAKRHAVGHHPPMEGPNMGAVHGNPHGGKGKVVYGIMMGDDEGHRWYFETDELPLPPSELAKIMKTVKAMKAHPEAMYGERGEGCHGECRGEAHGGCRGACHDQGHGECRGEAGEGGKVMKRRVEIRVAHEGRAFQGEHGKGPRCKGECSRKQPF